MSETKRRSSEMLGKVKILLYGQHPVKDVPVNILIKYFLKTGDASAYRNYHDSMCKDPIDNKLICDWLNQLLCCINLLDWKTEQLVINCLTVPWHRGNKRTKSLFRDFIISVVTAHLHHTRGIIESLLLTLIPKIPQDEAEIYNLSPGKMTKDDKLGYEAVCQLIADIVQKVPLICPTVMYLAAKKTPYVKKLAHCHVVYTYNMLFLSEKMPLQCRCEFYEIIFNNMITLDLHSPRHLCEVEDDEDDQIFEMDTDEPNTDVNVSMMNHDAAHSLDSVMMLMLRFVHSVVHGDRKLSTLITSENFSVAGCELGSVTKSDEQLLTKGCQCNKANHNKSAAMELYESLKYLFDKIILPTKSISHTQFIMFYTISMRPSLLIDFLEFLKVKSFDITNSLDVRCNAVAYTAAFVCRGSFVTYEILHSCLQVYSSWCMSYIRQIRQYVGSSHRLFYYICQTLLYSFTFKYKEYTKTPERIKDALSLHLDDLVHCSLNPLRFCSPSVTKNFAAISSHFQLSYCYVILEENKRFDSIPHARTDEGVISDLTRFELYFPFDPYLLIRTKPFIIKHFVEFDGFPEGMGNTSTDHHHTAQTKETMEEFSFNSFDFSVSPVRQKLLWSHSDDFSL